MKELFLNSVFSGYKLNVVYEKPPRFSITFPKIARFFLLDGIDNLISKFLSHTINYLSLRVIFKNFDRNRLA